MAAAREQGASPHLPTWPCSDACRGNIVNLSPWLHLQVLPTTHRCPTEAVDGSSLSFIFQKKPLAELCISSRGGQQSLVKYQQTSSGRFIAAMVIPIPGGAETNLTAERVPPLSVLRYRNAFDGSSTSHRRPEVQGMLLRLPSIACPHDLCADHQSLHCDYDRASGLHLGHVQHVIPAYSSWNAWCTQVHLRSASCGSAVGAACVLALIRHCAASCG